LPLRRAGTDLLVDHLLKSICHEKRRFSYIWLFVAHPRPLPREGWRNAKERGSCLTSGIGSPLPWEGVGVGYCFWGRAAPVPTGSSHSLSAKLKTLDFTGFTVLPIYQSVHDASLFWYTFLALLIPSRHMRLVDWT
jgi:hypothetical protein